MNQYQERVVAEKDDLNVKIVALENFIDGSVFRRLDPKEQIRLRRQSYVMDMYYNILSDRISAFGKVQQNTNWIPVSTPPIEGEQVVVWNTGYKGAETAFYKDGEFFDTLMSQRERKPINLTSVVSHWQPLTKIAPENIKR
jgi:hypothetical protein